MRRDWIVMSAARNAYLSPAGLVAPAFRKIAKKRLWRDWRLDLKCLVAIIAVTMTAGYLVANGKEIKEMIFPPRVISNPIDDVVAVLKSIDASGKHLGHNMDIDNYYTARNFYDRFLANSGGANETNGNGGIQLPAIPATGGNDANR